MLMVAPGTKREKELTDSFDTRKRSSIMRAVKSEKSLPEMRVRKAIHRAGFRYRLHAKDLPGKPDLVFPRYKTVLFINGCFWHWHGCPRTRMAKSNTDYWQVKIEKNVRRDRDNHAQLRRSGWIAIIIWECSIDEGIQNAITHLEALRYPG
jgi:DNA mismatch endonuclease (patch repair protein)